MNDRIKKLLELIESQQITPEQGLTLFKEIRSQHSDNPVTLFFNPVWMRSDIKISHQNKEALFLIFDTDEQVYERLCNTLENQKHILITPGEKYQSVGNNKYSLNPENQKDYYLLAGDLYSKYTHIPFNIIYLWSKWNRKAESIEKHLSLSIYPMFYLTHALMSQKPQERIRLLYFYERMKDIELIESPNHPTAFHTAISGFAKTVSLENSKFLYKTVGLQNLSDADETVNILPQEFKSDDSSAEILYKAKERFAKQLQQHDLAGKDAHCTPLKNRGIYLITGGMGGLGRIFAKYLARKWDATLILTGRSELSPGQMKILKNTGSDACYIRADVSVKEDVERLIAEVISRYKKIDGVIHAAGALRDAFILKKEQSDIQAVLAPKIYGAIFLDEATRHFNLDFFICFSSLSAVMGNAGQCDYAYANSFMDAFTGLRDNLRACGKRSGKSLSFNWTLWRDGGMQIDKNTEEWLARTKGMYPMPTESGLSAFEKGLAFNGNQFIVVNSNQSTLESNRIFGKNPIADQPHPNKIDPAELRRFVWNDVSEIASIILKINPEEIHPDADMSEYGFDSFSLTDFVNHINKRFTLELMPALFFEYTSLGSFVRYLCEEYKEKIGSWRLALSSHEPTAHSQEPTAQSQEPTARSHELRPDTQQPIAIIGISGVMPQCEDLDTFWNHLKNGDDLITEIPKERWDWKAYHGDPLKEENKTRIKWGGFIKDIERFDAPFFGISPREAELMDPQQRIILEQVWKCIENAGYKASELSGTKTGVFIGVSAIDFYDRISVSGITPKPHIPTGVAHSILTNRISYIFNFRGPSEPVDTACSSSLVALHRAVISLQNKECEIAIAGGVNILLTPGFFISLDMAGMLSPDGKCKTFDSQADGYVRAEGCGVVLLKPLEKALKDGDYIYGVIKGTAVNHGGHVSSLTAPNPNAQAELITAACEKANIDPATITYIEAHGTGTKLGDPVEISGLKKAFSGALKLRHTCGVGSVKTNIGHLESAAGIAGLLKVLLSMKHKTLPASIHFNQINPQIQLENSPFYIVTGTQEWKRLTDDNGNLSPRRSGISSFGFGGSNAHAVVEEYDDSSFRLEPSELHVDSRQPIVFLFSAKDEERLIEYAGSIADFLKVTSYSLSDIAYTLQVGREPMEERLAIIASDKESLIKTLIQYIKGAKNTENIFKGNVKRLKGIAAFLLEGEEGEEYVKIILKNRNIRKIAQLWVSGTEFNWRLLYPNTIPNRIPLPTYPFAGERFPIPGESQRPALRRESQTSALTGMESQSSVLTGNNTLYFQEVWKESLLPPQIPVSGSVLLFDMEESLQNALTEKSDIRVIRVVPGERFKKTKSELYEINPGIPDNYQELVKSLNKLPDYVVHSWSQKRFIPEKDALHAQLETGLYSVCYLIQSLMRQKPEDRIRFLFTYPMSKQSVDTPEPQYAALSGFLKSVELENSVFVCKTIGLNNKNALLQEIFCQENKNSDICYLGEKRFVRRVNEFGPDKETVSNLSLKQKGVYLITGGMGGLGLIFAEYLAKNYSAKLALSGRSESEDSTTFGKLSELESYGAEVIYLKADVSKQEDTEMLISQVKAAYGKLNGIIHCAGVAGKGFIRDMTYEEAEKIIAPKVFGTVWLDEATKNEEMDFFALFSSIAAITENLGLSAYAFANRFMDYFAERRESLRLQQKRFGKTLSINWPLWKDGGMITPEQTLRILFRTMGMKPLSKETGINAFVRGLSLPQTRFIVIQGDPVKIRESLYFEERIDSGNEDSAVMISDEELSDKVRKDMVKIISEILKVKESDILLYNPMDSYGFDSIMLTEFAEKINEKYVPATRISPAIFFEHTSVDSFNEYLIKKNRTNLVRYYGERVERNQIFPKNPISTEIRQPTADSQQPIAIIGMSGIMPGSEELDAFWNHLENGDDLITEIPKERWERILYDNESVKLVNIQGGFLKNIDRFDASFFGILPKEAELTDPQQRIFLETAWKCIEDAGIKASELSGTNTGIFVGVTISDYNELLQRYRINAEAYMTTGLSHSMIANRVSYLLNLHGPSEAIDTACSSSLVAVCRAVEAIRSGRCDMAIAGGVNALLSPTSFIITHKAGMLSKSGRCRTFDKNADGYVRGEGCGAILLKSLSKAEADRDPIYAVIKGIAVNHGGRANALTAPNPNAQADVIVNAYEDAGIDPDRISYIEAHGTGTELGDPIEINGLKKAFATMYQRRGKSMPEKPHCGIGTVKTYIGHLESAAGIAGVIKTVLSMKHGKLPGNLHFQELNPYIQLDEKPFYILDRTRQWNSQLPRVAGVSAFGFGGTNAHIVLEEYKHESKERDIQHSAFSNPHSFIIPLSAKNEERLKEYARKLAEYLGKRNDDNSRNVSLADIAYTLQTGRESMEERLALIVSSIDELKEKLIRFAQGKSISGHFYTGLKKLNLEYHNLSQLVKKSQDIDKIAQLWTDGASLNWNLLYSGKQLNRISSLPTYPFANERYWIPESGVSKKYPEKTPSVVSAKHSLKQGYMETSEYYSLKKGVAKLERFSELLLLNIFERWGVFKEPEREYTKKDLKKELKIIPGYFRLFDALTDILSNAGFIQVTAERLKVCSVVKDKDFRKELDQLDAKENHLTAAFPEIKPHFRFLRICAEAYPEILTGRKNHRDILFPEGSSAFVEKIYKGNIITDYYSRTTADTVRNYIEQRLQREPGANIRILEVGAGTGGTSAFVLNAIKKYREHLCYFYTDISNNFKPYFETYKAEYPFAEFRLLDIEFSPEKQGFETDSFDAVIGANVIHATKDIENTLDNIKRLLIRNGVLIVNEVTRITNFSTMTFGLTTGWWLFEDENNRIKGSPLLSAEKWRAVLENTGFHNIRIVGFSDSSEKNSECFQHLQNLSENDADQCLIIAENNGHVIADAKPRRAHTGQIPKTSAVISKNVSGINPIQESGKDLLNALTEYLIQKIAEVVRIDSTAINPNADFEDLGLDSIIINQLNSELQEQFGKLPSTLFFTYKTIRNLAKYFAENHEEIATKIIPQKEGSDKAEKKEESTLWHSAEPNIWRSEDIAIIGLSGKYPMAENISDYWENLKAGKNCVTEIPKQRWDYQRYPGIYCKWGGFLNDADKFDPLFFNISPSTARAMDPQERLFLQAAWSCIEDACYTRKRLEDPNAGDMRGDVGVFAGISFNDYQLYLASEWEKGNIIPIDSQICSVANRVSYILNLRGPSLSVDTACSSSLYALHLACESIRHKECEMAIAGGVNLTSHPAKYVTLCDLQMLSRKGHCNAFGDGGDGMVSGEAVGAVLLKPLDKAIKDNDHIYAVIKGTAVNHGGKTHGYTVPNPVAQTEVIRRAIDKSRIDPKTVSYVEAHGTGTSLGDPIEITGLVEAFKAYTDAKQFCAIGSVKSNIGHSEAAAGIAQLTKVILQMQHKLLVPSLIYSEQMNPGITFEESPFYLQRTLEKWNSDSVRRAGISSFGATGVNVHVIIEEYQPSEFETPKANRIPVIIPLSAKSESVLLTYAKQLKIFLEKDENRNAAIEDVAYSMQIGREPMRYRLSFTAGSVKELCHKTELLLLNPSADTEGIYKGQKNDRKEEDTDYIRFVIEKKNADKIARLWVQGTDIDWNLLYSGQTPRCISLPTYPFLKERYWISEGDLSEDLTSSGKLSNLAIPETERYETIVKTIRNIAGKILGFNPSEPPPVDQGFFDMGMESVQAMELQTEISVKFGVELYDTALFDYPNISDLSQYVAEQSKKPCQSESLPPRQSLTLRSQDERIYCNTIWEKSQQLSANSQEPRANSHTILLFDTDMNLYNYLVSNGLRVVLAMPGNTYRSFDNHIYEINPAAWKDYDTLAEDLTKQALIPERLVHLWSEGDFNSSDTLNIQIERGCYSIFYLTQSLMKQRFKETIQMVYIHPEGNGIQPQFAAVNGFVRTARLENPRFAWKMIQIPEKTEPVRLWNMLSPEFQSDDEPEISYDKTGNRWVKRIREAVPVTVPTMPDLLKDKGVYLITGGAGGVGLIFAEYLAREFKAKLVLTGRSQLTPDKASKIELLNKTGAEVVYIAADISDYEDAKRLILQIKSKFKEINGVIHSAGVIRDSYIMKKMKEDFDAVIAPKIYGTINLDEALKDEPLDFFVMFSSMTAVGGNPGQSDYAYANGFMDNFALFREGMRAKKIRSGKTVSINWTLWREGGMELGEAFINRMKEKTGLIPIEKEDGIETFKTALISDNSQLGILKGEREKITAVFGLDKPFGKSQLKQSVDIPEHDDAIAVIGIACRFPGGCDTPEKFWEFLKTGKDGVIKIPPDRWNADAFYDPNPDADGKIYVKEAGFLQENIKEFDARFFGISPREASEMDPQQRLLLEVSWEALERAGHMNEDLSGSNTGVFVGTIGSEYLMLPKKSHKMTHYTVTGSAPNVASGRIAYVLGLHGPALSIDTACSSSLVSVYLACESLKRGECDMALAGGVNLTLTPYTYAMLCRLKALSKDGRCKAFDADGDGYGRGEGCGMAVLRKLSDALKDGDPILAVIKGYAVNHDGASGGLTVPNGLAQERLLRKALENSHLQPEDISYIEAHGTGTSLGDPVEIRAISKVFRREKNPLIIGAVKANIGHLEAAAGIAGLIKAVLCLQHKEIPPQVNLKKINPKINLKEIPAVVPDSLIQWHTDGKQRIAGVSSFGFSGTNAHVILSECQTETLTQKDRPLHILTISAKNETALRELIGKYKDFLENNPDKDIGNLCYSANTGRIHFPYRAAFIADSITNLHKELSKHSNDTPVKRVNDGSKTNITAPKDALILSSVSSDNPLMSLLQNLALLYCTGARIDWKGFDKGYTRRKEILPTYPFQRKAYWITDNTKPPTALDGKKIELSSGTIRFEYYLSRDSLPELRDNFGVLHVGYYQEMLCRAIKACYKTSDYTVIETDFLIAFYVPDATDRTLYLNIFSDKEGEAEFQFYSTPLNQKFRTLHAHGRIRLSKQSIETPHLGISKNIIEAVQKRCVNEVSGTEFYQTMASQRGMNLGESVKWIDRIWFRQGEALARFRSLDEGHSLYAFHVHPGIWDACAQVFFAAFPEQIDPYKKFMMVKWREFIFSPQKKVSDLWCHVQLSEDSGKDGLLIKGGFHLFDSRGPFVAQTKECHLKIVREEAADMVIAMTKSGSREEKRRRDKSPILDAGMDYTEKQRILHTYFQEKIASLLDMPLSELDLNEPLRNLGIDSITGMQFKTIAEDELDIEIPIESVLQGPSISKLTEIVLKNTEGVSKIDFDSGNIWFPYRRIKPEAQIRLFCIPYGAGGASIYRNWQEKLPSFAEVCPVQLPGREERLKENPIANIRELTDILERVLISESEIPFAIYGHSMGALIAFRVAYRLWKRTNRPIHLFIGGYSAPVIYPNPYLKNLTAKWQLLGFSGIPDVEEIKKFSSDQFKDFLKMDEINQLVRGDAGLLKIFLPMLVADTRIVESYKPNKEKPFDIPITVFHGENDDRVSAEDAEAWQRLTTGEFKLVNLPGDHFFLKEEQSQERLLEMISEDLTTFKKSYLLSHPLSEL